jgi:sugar fermentation stimulation protein A
MRFETPLIGGILIKRYKRFLADVRLADGTGMTVHCPNPGAMLGLNQPGSPVWISDSQNPKRKLRHTLELMQIDGTMVGINTNRANRLAREAMEQGMIKGVNASSDIVPEQKYGTGSRIDFLVHGSGAPDHFIEVKNVHLRRKAGLHEFPDSVTERGRKHLKELIGEVEKGNPATMLFMVQRDDGDRFAIADDIDPAYGEAFREALSAGVKATCIKCRVSEAEIVPISGVAISA